MKPNRSLRSFLALFGSALLAITTADATILYWDGNVTQTANADGGTGTWDTTALNWDTALTGGSASAWTTGDYAIFGTPAGTVTVGSGITTSGMQFNVHSYVIDASTNVLTFASGNNTISTNFTSVAGNITSINGTVAGTGANLLFTPVNPTVSARNHVISFGGASSGGWTGTTTIDKNMTARLQDTNQALLNSSSINLRGGVLLLTNTAAQNTLNRVKDDAVINSYGGSIRANNTVAAVDYTESLGELKLIGGNTTLLQMTTQTGANSQLMSFSSITRESGSLATLALGAPMNSLNMVRNAAVTTATTTNEIIGPWLITGNATSQGEYGRYDASGNILGYTRPAANNISAEGSLPTTWLSTANMRFTGSPTLTSNRVMNTLNTASSPTWQLGEFSLATNGLLAGGGNLTISVPTGAGYITAAGNVGSGNAIYLTSANGFLSLGAPIKDNGNPVTAVLVTGQNAGRIDLNAANEHTGGTVVSAPVFRNGAEGQTSAAGTVNLFNVNALGPNTTLLRMESGALNLNAIAATVGKFEGYASSFVTGTGGTIFTVGNGTAANVTGDFAGSIISVRLTKAGNGTQILSGVNTANNTTAQYTVNGGTLQFAKTSALMDSVVTNWTAAKVVGGNGGTLAFNVGGTGEFTTGNVTTLLTNLGGLGASVAANEGLQAGSRIGFDTTNAAGGTFTVTDLIADSTGAGGGAIGLTKLGTGTLSLTTASTYTGPTTVAAGTLALGVTDCLADTSNVVIGAAALSAAAAVTDTAGTLDVSAAAVINLGTGSALAFADSSSVNWTGGTLDITGTLGATSLRFGATSGGLTSGQLAVISVNGSGLGTYILDADGYLVASGGNTAPTISDIANQSVPSGGNTGPLAVTVNDAETAVGSLALSVSGNTNTGLVPNANIVFGGSGASRTVSVTPVSGLSGTATITIRVTDGGALFAEDSFTLTVTDNYLSWAASQVPPVTGGINGDDDNDGVKNLVEYALINGGERGVLSGNTITYTKRGGVYGSDVTYDIESSTDLSIWGLLAKPPVVETSGTISYTFTPSTPVKNFARLKVVTTP